MRKKECVAMLLAGGQGSRLKLLTEKIAKPAVSFGGKYRMVDFSLSNCVNSGIDTVGVLVQYKPGLLNRYLSTGAGWDLDADWGGLQVLPPYATQTGGEWYEGTADAIYHNIDFIDEYDPDYVLILSADHLYQMDYNLMLDYHKLMGADLTVAVKTVPWEDASRFGIMNVDDEMRITRFDEKPPKPESIRVLRLLGGRGHHPQLLRDPNGPAGRKTGVQHHRFPHAHLLQPARSLLSLHRPGRPGGALHDLQRL